MRSDRQWSNILADSSDRRYSGQCTYQEKKTMLVSVLVLFSLHDVATIDVHHGKILEYFSIAKSQEKIAVLMVVSKIVENPVSRSTHHALSMKQNLANIMVCELKLENDLEGFTEENFGAFTPQLEHEAHVPLLAWMNAKQNTI